MVSAIIIEISSIFMLCHYRVLNVHWLPHNFFCGGSEEEEEEEV